MGKTKNNAEKLGANDFVCDNCNTVLTISVELKHDKIIKCSKCSTAIKNPFFIKNNNKKISLVIKTLQDELVNRKKKYFIMSQASKVLRERNIINDSDISSGYLKNIIEKGKIPQAIQTITKPKQWRIHLDKSIETKNKKKIKSKANKKDVAKKTYTQPEQKPSSLINTERTHRANEDEVYFSCPMCGVNLSVPQKHRRHEELKCYHCHGSFKSPIIFPNDNTKYTKASIRSQDRNYLTNSPFSRTQVLTGFFILFILIASVRSCNETPEEAMKQYQKNQKNIREYEKKKKETEEYFEFMGGQE